MDQRFKRPSAVPDQFSLGAVFPPAPVLGAETLIAMAINLSPSFLYSTETYIPCFRLAMSISFLALVIFVLSSIPNVRVFFLLLHLSFNGDRLSRFINLFNPPEKPFHNGYSRAGAGTADFSGTGLVSALQNCL